MKTVVVAGATGFIGMAVCEELAQRGYQITALTRSPRPGIGPLRFVAWQPEDVASATTVVIPELEKACAVLNFAGEPIVQRRWNKSQKELIYNSRIHATRVLVAAMARSQNKPAVLVNASAVGFYGLAPSGDLEESASAGSDFLATLCRDWESEALKAKEHGTRAVCARIGVVMGLEGGALAQMLIPFKLGLGGPLGAGRQMMSWIHVEDLVQLLVWCVENPEVSGAINAVSPNPVTNEMFSKTLAKTLRRPCFFRVPAFVLKILMGEMSTVLLGGQRVLPKAALEKGFKFRFADLESALGEILRRAKGSNRS